MKAAVRIQREDISQDEEIRALQAGSKRIGGIATFLGCALVCGVSIAIAAPQATSISNILARASPAFRMRGRIT